MRERDTDYLYEKTGTAGIAASAANCGELRLNSGPLLS